MRIELREVAKRYSEQWIIRHCTLDLESGKIYGLTGPNGSGKSTLIKLLSGFLSPTKGRIGYLADDGPVSRDDIHRYVTLASPYALMFKQLTMMEMIRFIRQFKPLKDGMTESDFLKVLQLDARPNTYLKDLSSGQFQKFGLAAALLTQSEILLLDEPGSYLDEQAKAWFQNMLVSHGRDRLVVVASNDKSDLAHANARINIEDYK